METWIPKTPTKQNKTKQKKRIKSNQQQNLNGIKTEKKRKSQIN
jgi:hypothetical protein